MAEHDVEEGQQAGAVRRVGLAVLAALAVVVVSVAVPTGAGAGTTTLARAVEQEKSGLGVPHDDALLAPHDHSDPATKNDVARGLAPGDDALDPTTDAEREAAEGYVELLMRLRAVYAALESVGHLLRDDAVAGGFCDPALDRLDAINADIAFWAPDPPTIVSPATDEYVARVLASAQWGGLYLAHHYTRAARPRGAGPNRPEAGRKARELDPAAAALRQCLESAQGDATVSTVVARRLRDDGPEIVLPGHEWQMPQGGVDQGEDLVAAARRELQVVGHANGGHDDAGLGRDLPADRAHAREQRAPLLFVDERHERGSPQREAATSSMLRT